MAFEMPRLRRALLGYKKPAVEKLLVEREEMFSAAVKEKSELSARLDEKTRELARLRTELSEFAEEANASRDRSAEQEAQVEAARARVAELEVQQGALEQRLTEQKQLARSSEGRLAVIQAELDSHKEIARIANEGTTRAEELAAERNEQLTDLRKRMGGLEAEARTAEQSTDAAQRALGEAERRAHEEQVELDTLRHQVASRVDAATKQNRRRGNDATDRRGSRASSNVSASSWNRGAASSNEHEARRTGRTPRWTWSEGLTLRAGPRLLVMTSPPPSRSRNTR